LRASEDAPAIANFNQIIPTLKHAKKVQVPRSEIETPLTVTSSISPFPAFKERRKLEQHSTTEHISATNKKHEVVIDDFFVFLGTFKAYTKVLNEMRHDITETSSRKPKLKMTNTFVSSQFAP